MADFSNANPVQCTQCIIVCICVEIITLNMMAATIIIELDIDNYIEVNFLMKKVTKVLFQLTKTSKTLI